MERNIYDLLNEVETDLTEYEETALSSQEKDRHKQKILAEVRSMEKGNKKENRKRNRNGKAWKTAAGMAAACALVAGAAGMANPVLAKNLFSDVFGKLIENSQGEKYEKEDTEKYTKIGENAVAIQKEVDQRQETESYVTTDENNGVTISVSDVYCDGYVLYYTASLKTDNEALNQADGILPREKVGTEQVKLNGTEMAGFCGGTFNKAEDGSFVAVKQIDLMTTVDSNEKEADLSLDENETLVVDYTLSDLEGNLWDSWDDQGEYEVTGIVEGEWHLRFPVTVDTSGNETININKEENGILIKNAVKTKAGLVLEIELPDFTNIDPYNDPNMAIKDSQGNCLQWLSQKWDHHQDKTAACQIMVLYDGQRDLSFEVTNKNEDDSVIADIAFQIP